MAWAVGLILLAPVIVLLLSLFAPASIEASEAWTQVREFLLGDAIKETVILIAGSCFLAFVLGVPAAWFIENFHFPGRRLLAIALILPLAIPPYLAAYLATDAREKLIPFLVSIRQEHGIEHYLLWEEGLRYGCLILIFASVLYPYVFLAGRSVFSQNGVRLGEAGGMLGRSPWKVFWQVQLPLARPALVAGLFLVAMEVLNDYGAVKHFGFNTLTVTIFTTWFDLNQIAVAKELAGWIILSVFAMVLLEQWQRGRARLVSAGGIVLAPRPPRSKTTLIFCYLSCLIPVGLGLVFPLQALFRWLGDHANQFTPEAKAELWQTTWNSLKLGLLATVGCLVAAIIVVGITRYHRSRPQRMLARISTVAGYACPGTVIALGVFGLAVFLRDQLSWPIFAAGGLLWLFLGIVSRYFSVASQMLDQGLARQKIGLDQAAHSLGQGPLQTFWKINLPLLTPSILGGATLVFVDVCKELPLCLLLRPFEFETLSTLAYGKVDQGTIYASAAPSLFLISLCMLGLIGVELNGWRALNRRSR